MQYRPLPFDKSRVVTGTFARGGAFLPELAIEMLVLTKNAGKILTDSGGLQKEAYFAKVPCITLDTVSAWPETVEDGWNMVVGEETECHQIKRKNIIDAVRSFEPNENNLIYLVTGRQQKIYVICWSVNNSKWYCGNFN